MVGSVTEAGRVHSLLYSEEHDYEFSFIENKVCSDLKHQWWFLVAN